MTEFPVRTPIKLVQFLKLTGIAESGAHATALVASGEVSVNGAVCGARSHQLGAGDTVTVGGESFTVTEQ